MSTGILIERDGAIATVTLSNPDKLNALTVAMWREVARVMGALSGDETLRCVVLRGAGDKAPRRQNGKYSSSNRHRKTMAMSALAGDRVNVFPAVWLSFRISIVVASRRLGGSN